MKPRHPASGPSREESRREGNGNRDTISRSDISRSDISRSDISRSDSASRDIDRRDIDWRSIGRRQFGLAAAACLATPACGWAQAAYDQLDTDRYLGAVEVIATIEDNKVFTEGPAVAPNGDLYFTNVPAEKILRWDIRAAKLSVFRSESHQANGLIFDSQGRLLACEGGSRRVTRTDMKTGAIEVLAERHRSFPLAAPNDLCVDRKGRIYFSSRPGVSDPQQGNVNAVYRIDPDGKLEQVLRWPDIHMPNGLDLSPDQKTLYLIEAHPDKDRHRDIRAYDIDAQGGLSNERVTINFYPGRSGDGMCVGPDGNLYVAAGLHQLRGTSETLDTRPGIHIVSPQGQLVGFRETPEDTLTNCTIDAQRKWLYATCNTKLLRIKMA